jgi:cation diffusion facilitator CzcD-associated flavoprotein CzcO
VGIRDRAGLRSDATPKHTEELQWHAVGIVGTGPSTVQFVADSANHLYVFQRAPNFSLPGNEYPTEPEVQHIERRREASTAQPYSLRMLPLTAGPDPLQDSVRFPKLTVPRRIVYRWEQNARQATNRPTDCPEGREPRDVVSIEGSASISPST